MNLSDIGKSPDSTIRKINQHLEANYGFKIAENMSDRDLVSVMEQIEGEITDLKIRGDDAKGSPEISKRLLVLEGIKTLREFAILQFQSPHLEKVVSDMVDFVVNDFTNSGMHHGDFEQSVKDAMKLYRSSKYRFPDDAIEQRVRQGAMTKCQAISQDEHELPTGGLDEAPTVLEDDSEDEAQGDSETSGVDGLSEEDMYGSVGKRASSFGGHAASTPDSPQANYAMRVLDNPKLSLSQDDNPVPIVRNPNTGRMQVDPLAAQNRARRTTGIIHKEGKEMKEHQNLVKNLRRLLETEVSQAEVMMAAKGFAQELQEMIEKIGRLQNEDLPPVTDQMRETYGMESSSAFQTQIYGALQGVMDALYTAKGQVDDAVSNMAQTGQFNAETDMDVPVDGMDDGVSGDITAGTDSESDLDNIAGDMDMDAGTDEFGAENGEEPLGRSMKTEAKKLQKKVLEMKKLVAKAKQLKEFRNA